MKLLIFKESNVIKDQIYDENMFNVLERIIQNKAGNIQTCFETTFSD